MKKHSNITIDLLNGANNSPLSPVLILSNQEIDYKTLDFYVWHATGYLYECGVRKKDIVGLTIGNELLRIVFSLSVIRLGATLFPLARSLTPYQKKELMSSAKIKFLVVDHKSFSFNGVSLIYASLHNLKHSKKINYKLLCEEPDALCMLVPGSGSSGKQKIIPQSHSQLQHRISLAFHGKEYDITQRVLSLTNQEFASGINRLLSVIHNRGALALFDDPSMSIPNFCNEKRITTLFGAVFHIEKILSSSNNKEESFISGLSALRISGSTIGLSLRERVREFINPNLHIVYGANECGRISMGVPPHIFTDQFSVGEPLPGVKVEIVDETDGVLLKGSRGLIRVKTESMISGYWNDPNATQEYFRDGWFYIGDVGEISEMGHIRHFGRADNMIILNGINIYPSEIEQTLKEIANLKDVVVLPIKHPIHQQIPIAFVCLNSEEKIKPDNLLGLVRERLGFRSPAEVFIVDSIPRNGNGKVQLSLLTNLIKRRLK